MGKLCISFPCMHQHENVEFEPNVHICPVCRGYVDHFKDITNNRIKIKIPHTINPTPFFHDRFYDDRFYDDSEYRVPCFRCIFCFL